jgi:hypothetical protein
MLTQGKFLISYQIFDNIPVNNNGQTHVREILKDTQAFTINYRTEQIRDYLKYPGEELISEHLHMINALKEIQNYWNLTSEDDLFENLRENLIRMDLTKGADDQYYDYSPSQVEAILFGILQLTPEHQDIIVIDLKKHLKSFIQDKDQAEEMITQYTCYYNAIKRWESNHKETEILHQLEISNK